MINSIKYILAKKDMKQQQLVVYRYQRQYVSKVVNRHFRVPAPLIEKWENLLNVPSNFFVDDQGLCKELTSLELHELDRYLSSHVPATSNNYH